MAQGDEPSNDQASDRVHQLLIERSNWGRWGDKSESGAANLITSQRIVQAAQAVKEGAVISLSRELPMRAALNNPRPVGHFMEVRDRAGHQEAGVAADHLTVTIHGAAMTHMDALCHNWGAEGMWDGRDPQEEIGFSGAEWGAIDVWKDGLVTRGVLLDVPAHRNEEYVVPQSPVTGTELREIAENQGIDIAPGDALVVYSGRDAWEKEHGPWGARSPEDFGSDATGNEIRPGLDYTCLEPIRDWDASILAWDMLDAGPNPSGVPWGVHGAIYSYGMVIIDNARLEPLAAYCQSKARFTFMFVASPLAIPGGTGSPVNPLAIL